MYRFLTTQDKGDDSFHFLQKVCFRMVKAHHSEQECGTGCERGQERMAAAVSVESLFPRLTLMQQSKLWISSLCLE